MRLAWLGTTYAVCAPYRVYTYVGNNPINLIDPNGLYGVGINAGGTIEGGIPTSLAHAAGQANSGIGVYSGGDQGLNIGGYTASGGFSGLTGEYEAAYGATAGLGVGLYITNATNSEQPDNVR